MRCRDIDRLSSAYIDGELDDARASALRGHLHKCERCLGLITAAAELRDAAEELGPIDPPPALWNQIERELSRAEMADAERPRLWLWWHAARQHLLPVAVVCTAVVLFVVWSSRRGEQPLDDVAGVRDVVDSKATSQTPPPLKTAVVQRDAPMPARTFVENRIDEIDRADARYVAVINELKKVVARERRGWSRAASARFDNKLAALEARVRDQRTVMGPPTHDPSQRDELYAVYQAQIDLLQRASFGEVPR